MSELKFSICIPHYNRSQCLLAVLDSVAGQNHPHVEVVISDDCSTDDSEHVIPAHIAELHERCQVSFRYVRQEKNVGYDANLRFAMELAQGDYLFLLGNDDALATETTLARLAETLEKLNLPDVAYGNAYTWGRPEERICRASETTCIGSGPTTALRVFRRLSFVSGVLFKRVAFERVNTDRYDGSIYVQIYLGTRIIASGGTVASIAESTVAKDVRLPGQAVASYLDVLARDNQQLAPKTGGLDQVAVVACAAILPHTDAAARWRYAVAVYAQLFAYSYPYWLVCYRRSGVPRAAWNLAWGCFPSRLLHHKCLPPAGRVFLLVVYVGSTAIGLLAPSLLIGQMAKFYRRLSSRGKRPAALTKSAFVRS